MFTSADLSRIFILHYGVRESEGRRKEGQQGMVRDREGQQGMGKDGGKRE